MEQQLSSGPVADWQDSFASGDMQVPSEVHCISNMIWYCKAFDRAYTACLRH